MNPNDEFASDRHQHLVGVGAASLQITVVYYNRRERKGQGWGEKDRFRVGGLNWKIGDATYNTMVTSVHSTRLRKNAHFLRTLWRPDPITSRRKLSDASRLVRPFYKKVPDIF
jgi:hypothetical protein